MKKYKIKSSPKYGNKKTQRDGWTFDSQHEAKVYDQLKYAQKSGEIDIFLRQVPFHLPGHIIYKADFVIFFSNGDVEVWDAKSRGTLTKEYLMKKRMVRECYSIEIKEIY